MSSIARRRNFLFGISRRELKIASTTRPVCRLPAARQAGSTGRCQPAFQNIELACARAHLLGLRAGASLLLNSDAHGPEDLLTEELAHQIGLGAGLDRGALTALIETNPRKLLERLGFSPP